MRTIVDSKTGILVLMPESKPDHRLIFHLINCSELSEFSRYLELEEQKDREITESLEVTGEQLLTYPSKTTWERTETALVDGTGFNRLSGNLIGFKV